MRRKRDEGSFYNGGDRRGLEEDFSGGTKERKKYVNNKPIKFMLKKGMSRIECGEWWQCWIVLMIEWIVDYHREALLSALCEPGRIGSFRVE